MQHLNYQTIMRYIIRIVVSFNREIWKRLLEKQHQGMFYTQLYGELIYW